MAKENLDRLEQFGIDVILGRRRGIKVGTAGDQSVQYLQRSVIVTRKHVRKGEVEKRPRIARPRLQRRIRSHLHSRKVFRLVSC